jgi:GWxTD domain-containing protein
MRANLWRQPDFRILNSSTVSLSSHPFKRFSAALVFVLSARWCAVAIFTAFSATQMWSQSGWAGDALVQRMPDGRAYVEVQTAWNSDLTTPSDSVIVTVMAVRGDVIHSFSKDRVLLRPNVEDSLPLSHVHVRRLFVPDGAIRIEWSVLNADSTIWLHNEGVHVPLGGAPEFADPLVIRTHSKATSATEPDLVHSGLALLPQVGRSIPAEASSAAFYVELHGMSDVVGSDSLFLLVYGWADASGDWQPSWTKYSRLKAAQIVPVFETLPCTPSVPSLSSPTLKLEARTREGHVVVSRDVVLGSRRVTSTVPMERSSTQEDLPSLAEYTTVEALVKHVEDHLAVATTNEQNTMQHTLLVNRNAVEMRRYLTGFWLERSANAAEADARHRQYIERISFVDATYGDCKYGQGSLTEMGNIYLRFGKPNTVVKRHHETDYYPYEIWHYYKAGRFNNKRFLFYAPHVVAECFELLHSDMLGERQNDDWLTQLRSRENRLRVSESMENRLNPRDSFSREEPEDLFYNPR